MDSAEINVQESQVTATYNSARLQALQYSAQAGNAAIRNLRKKSRQWYELSLHRMLTYVCDETSAPEDFERCVIPSSVYAAHDISNQCISVSDTESCTRKGLCERKSNCRWDDPIANATSRRQFFSLNNITTAKSWMENGYLTSFAGFLVPGTVISVLISVGFVFFLVLRCLFNQCGGRNPREQGYSRCDIVIPSSIFIICFLAVFICAVFTAAQNTNISEEVASIFNSLGITLENLSIFARNLQIPLEQTIKQIQSSESTVTSTLQDTEWIQRDSRILHDMIFNYSTTYASRGPFPYASCTTSDVFCIQCNDKVCGSPLLSFMNSSLAALAASKSAVQIPVSTLSVAFAQTTSTLSALQSAVLQLSELGNLTNASRQSTDVLQNAFESYSFSRTALVLCVFLFAMVASILGMAGIFQGICKKKTSWNPTLHASWTLNVLVCILGFVLSSALLAIGALWYDSCNYLTILRSDMSPYFPSRLSGMVNTCFNGTSLLSSLAIEEKLAFSCALEDNYQMLSTANIKAPASYIEKYGEFVKDFGLGDFGYNVTLSRQLISKSTSAASDANTSAKESFTQDNIMIPWEVHSEAPPSATDCPNTTAFQLPNCYMSLKCKSGTGTSLIKGKCASAFLNAYYYVAAFSQISDMLDQMREDLLGDTGKGFASSWRSDVSMGEFAESYQKRVIDFQSNTLGDLRQQSLRPLMESIESVRCSDNCGWINIAYNKLYDDLCDDVLGTTLAISLCAFFLSIFLIPMIVTAVILQKRLRGTKQGTYEHLEKRLQMLEVKAREQARARANLSPPPRESTGVVDLLRSKLNLDSA
uniref:Uncharacterized protein AlNc14C218G9065 n=1 Tax=Albugo laibachii Nc14 TaxID=890382 RepID=F0WRR9_9STRA|nr:conserved hypothetical protein [Albugo laibachii Nc14]|eukprot:CCA24034.1 conserved hypothetical protein [Albugo laibachii Nc14]